MNDRTAGCAAPSWALAGALLCIAPASLAQDADWTASGGDRGGMRYSTLDQIDRGNVARLEVAWVYRTGELVSAKGKRRVYSIQCTPLIVAGVMYVTTARTRVVALDAARGEEIWSYDPFAEERPGVPIAANGVNRGVAFWSDGKEGGARRVVLGTADGRLVSLDAATGRPDPAFGEEGVVDLRRGLPRHLRKLDYGLTSPPGICRDAIVAGVSVGEGPRPGAPGDVRAVDVRTGEELWRFHTVPRPGEFGHDTWEGDSWEDRGGANAWGGVSSDEERNTVFVGLGSAAWDFYGGDRKGMNLFANSTVALDAATGERVWHFQSTHHDVWDHDIPTYPNLVTVTRGGRRIDAVAQVTKTGYVFLFDRETGEPLFEIEERPSPTAQQVAGEEVWPTQPVPVKPPPFSRQRFDEEDVTDISPEARAAVLAEYRKLDAGPAHVPISARGTILFPGLHGGATWSGASFDPTSGLLYVNANNVPWVIRLEERPAGSEVDYRIAEFYKFEDPEGYPAVKPPWGTLSAIDLNRGEIRWQVPLGALDELSRRGIPPTGSENFGGSIVTAGGLVFIGASQDEKLHAYDKATGELLWEHRLPAGGYAQPSTYSVNGRQYVVIAAGGGGKPGTRHGDSFVAFALP